MWSYRIVFYEPVRETNIEHLSIRSVVPKTKKFFFECPVKSLVPRIVLRSLGTAPPMRKIQIQEFRFEVFVKLAPVIGMNMDDISIEEISKSSKEVSRSKRSM